MKTKIAENKNCQKRKIMKYPVVNENYNYNEKNN